MHHRGAPGRALLGSLVLTVMMVACGDGAATTVATVFSGFDGCQAGAGSVVTFLQRTLDQIDDAEPDELARFVADFDEGVDALLLRAQEVHCTEVGFNNAVIARVGDLDAHGSAGDLLIEIVGQRGLGSRAESRGGPIRLPAD